MASSMCQLDSLCEIPSSPLDDLCYHRQPPLTPCQYKLGHVCLALLSLGKDIHLILVYNHIFLSIGLINLMITFSLSIGLFNLFCNVYYLRSDNSLFM